MNGANVNTLEDLRAEVMRWQGLPYLALLENARGTDYEANVRVLGSQMTTLNQSIKYGAIDLPTAINRFNGVIDVYNVLVSSIRGYTGFGYYPRAVYTAVRETPGMIVEAVTSAAETALKYGKEAVSTTKKTLIYAGLAALAGLLLYGFASGYGKGLGRK